MAALEKMERAKLLLADDDKEVTAFMADFFRERGYAVQSVNERDKILSVYKDFQPDLVLLDVNFSGGKTLADGTKVYDGIEVLEAIKSYDASAKVIMVTAMNQTDVTNQAKAKGAIDFFLKPINLEYLETTVMEKIQEALAGPSDTRDQSVFNPK